MRYVDCAMFVGVNWNSWYSCGEVNRWCRKYGYLISLAKRIGQVCVAWKS